MNILHEILMILPRFLMQAEVLLDPTFNKMLLIDVMWIYWASSYKRYDIQYWSSNVQPLLNHFWEGALMKSKMQQIQNEFICVELDTRGIFSGSCLNHVRFPIGTSLHPIDHYRPSWNSILIILTTSCRYESRHLVIQSSQLKRNNSKCKDWKIQLAMSNYRTRPSNHSGRL